MLKKINKHKLSLYILGTSILASFFMVALTFNFIGNGTSTGNLIVGFALSMVVIITSIVGMIIIHKKSNLDKYIFIAALIIFGILIIGLAFGTMGYLEFK